MAVEVSPTASWEDISSWEGGVCSVEISFPKKPLRDPEDALNAAPGEGSSNKSSTNVGASSTNITSNDGGGRADMSKSVGCVKEGISPRNGAALPLPVELPGGGNPGSGDGCRNGQNPKEHENTAEGEIEIGSVRREQGGQIQEQEMAAAGQEMEMIRGESHSHSTKWTSGGRTATIHGKKDRKHPGGRTDSTASDRVSGFHDSICLGFAVALCLNSAASRLDRKGFFTAEVKCNLRDPFQTGRSRRVGRLEPNRGEFQKDATTFDLQEMSMAGSIMGVLTVVGHSADAVVNALGCIILFCTRRKRVKIVNVESDQGLVPCGAVHVRVVARDDGHRVPVGRGGLIGSAAVAFYSREFDLECDSSVSVGVDYAYAMTTLTILCQFFIGIVALPRPPRWWFCGRKGAARARSGRRR
ncbi:unnamed protein product [Ascophyllum nodosum]